MNRFDLFEFLLRGGVLLLVACLIGWKISRDGFAHRYWKGVFGLLFLMALIGLGPSFRSLNLGVEKSTPFSEVTRATVAPAENTVPVGGYGVNLAQSVAPPAATENSRRWSIEPIEILLWLWFSGVAIGLVRLGRSRVRLARLLRAAVPLSIDGEKVLCSGQVTAPLSFGLFRRGIVVPSDFELWSADEREMALRHERCHVRRRDGLWQLSAALLAVLHWPNPLVWLALRRMERECELAVDAEVLDSGMSPTGYSELLVRLASAEGSDPTIATAMARKSTVPLRVERILNRGDRGAVTLGSLLWLVVGFLGGVAITLGVTSLTSETVFPGDGEKETEAGKEAEMRSFTYSVSPHFIPRVSDDPRGGPLAAASVESPQRSAQEFLAEAGIGFPEGSLAYYRASESQLVVRNTVENMKLIATLIESEEQEWEDSQMTIYQTARMIEISKGIELPGLEWLTSGESHTIAGVFTDVQAQMVFRGLQEALDVDLLILPSIMVRNGKKGKIEILREYDNHPGLSIETTPVIAADEASIDLAIYLGNDSSGRQASITVWDGQTVAWREDFGDDMIRAIFLTVRIVDPSGKALNSDSPIPPPSGDGESIEELRKELEK